MSYIRIQNLNKCLEDVKEKRHICNRYKETAKEVNDMKNFFYWEREVEDYDRFIEVLENEILEVELNML